MVNILTRSSAYPRMVLTFCIISVFLINGIVDAQQAAGISRCSTKEIRNSVLDKMLAALQCDDYVCGRYN